MGKPGGHWRPPQSNLEFALHRPRRTPIMRFFLLCLLFLTAACSNHSETTSNQEVVSPNMGGDPALLDYSKTQSTSGDAFEISITPSTDPIPLNDYFSLTFRIDGKESGLSSADWQISANADMPGHNHGMQVSPEVRKLDDGRYEAETFLLHMPGHWEIYIDLEKDGRQERAIFHVMLD